MVCDELIAQLAKARERLPRDTWKGLTIHFARLPGNPDESTISSGVSALVNPDAVWMLSSIYNKFADCAWNEIAAAMVAVDHFVIRTGPTPEVLWTGPSNTRFPMRRLDQALYDLISSAQERVVLVTFSAHRIPHLCSHLIRAVSRGVRLTLIVESEEESEGQLTRDAMAAFRAVISPNLRIYYWPNQERERNHAGRPGKLHAKCAIVDDSAIIGSANLTDDAFNRNMELGLLLDDIETVNVIAEHFHDLIRRGVLIEMNALRD